MKTISINLYLLSELSESAQDAAIDNLHDINLHDEWFDSVYEDAKMIGLKITSFHLYSKRAIDVEQIEHTYKVADLIKANHGKDCDTYKLAEQYQFDWDALVFKHSDGIDTSVVSEENEREFDNEADELEEEFLSELGECYLSLLRNEYDYMQSREAIIETIEANEYYFTEDGELN